MRKGGTRDYKSDNGLGDIYIKLSGSVGNTEPSAHGQEDIIKWISVNPSLERDAKHTHHDR